MKLKTRTGAAGKKMKGSRVRFSGETWETAAETSKPKYSGALPALENNFNAPRPPKIFACQFFRRHLTLFLFQKHLNDEA
jgi:hypothetical protein